MVRFFEFLQSLFLRSMSKLINEAFLMSLKAVLWVHPSTLYTFGEQVSIFSSEMRRNE